MSLESNLSKLPESCYTVSQYSQALILLKRGEQGYYATSLSTRDPALNRAIADALNQNLGVSKAQEQAMFTGSLFGFHVPGADPAAWEQITPNRNEPDFAALDEQISDARRRQSEAQHPQQKESMESERT